MKETVDFRKAVELRHMDILSKDSLVHLFTGVRDCVCVYNVCVVCICALQGHTGPEDRR